MILLLAQCHMFERVNMSSFRNSRCAICRRIDFERYLREKITQPISLGSTGSVRYGARQGCPFCKLVVHTLDSYVSPSNLPYEGDINLRNELSWKLAVEPSCYDLSKSESYSNKYDLRSTAKHIHRAVYRFIIAVTVTGDEDGEQDVGYIQYLAHREKDPDHRQFFGRKLDAASVDKSLLKYWLSACRKWHIRHCTVEDCKKDHSIESFTDSTASHNAVDSPDDSSDRRSNLLPFRHEHQLHPPSEPNSFIVDGSPAHEAKTHHECERDIRIADDLSLNLRLIDVQRRLIIRVSSGEVPAYIALSYVWGSAEMKQQTGLKPAMLLRCDITKDSDGNERTSLPKGLPQTLEDAITLTRDLGFRYLWNDAICIIQDNPMHIKSKDLNSMKLVYSCSSLTIAAAAGRHADYGIPGVSVRRRFSPASQVVGGLRLATMCPTFTELENSSTLHWNTRGWTFQEKLLSRRLLLFTDYQVYFKCSESIWLEELYSTTGRLSKSVESRPAKYLWDPARTREIPKPTAEEVRLDRLLGTRRLKKVNPHLKVEDDWAYLRGFMYYGAAVKEFTKRDLTDPKDTLAAISGICETLESTLRSFTLGLPARYFREALVWQPSIGSLLRRNRTTDWSTWTWASWTINQGAIRMDMLDVRQIGDMLVLSGKLFELDSLGKDEDSSMMMNRSITSISEINIASMMNRLIPLMSEINMARSLRGTYSNLWTLLNWPGVSYGHTIQQIFYYDGESSSQLNLDEASAALLSAGIQRIGPDLRTTLAIPSAFMFLPFVLDEFWAARVRDPNTDWVKGPELTPHNAHILIFQASIVSFFIGEPLAPRKSQYDDEVGIFKLVTSRQQVVGEVITTYQKAASRRRQDFIGVSWGFSLQAAWPDSHYVPRWDHDGDDVRSKTKEESEFVKTARAAAFQRLSWQQGSILPSESILRWMEDLVPGGWLPIPDAGPDKSSEQPALELFLLLFEAAKGNALPRNLWPTVNLLMVEWDGKIARRVGVGKAVKKAWCEKRTPPRRVVLG